MVKRGIETEHALLAVFMVMVLLVILASPNELIISVANALTGQVVNDLSLEGSPEPNLLAITKAAVSENYILFLELLSGVILILIIILIVKSVIKSRRYNDVLIKNDGLNEASYKKEQSISRLHSKNDFPLTKELKEVNQELSSLASVEEEKPMKLEEISVNKLKPNEAKGKKSSKTLVLAASNNKYSQELDYLNRELASLGYIKEKPAAVKKEIPALIQKKVSMPEPKVKIEKPLKAPERKLELKVSEEFLKRKSAIKEEKILDEKMNKLDSSSKRYFTPQEAINDADKISKEIKDLVRDYFA